MINPASRRGMCSPLPPMTESEREAYRYVSQLIRQRRRRRRLQRKGLCQWCGREPVAKGKNGQALTRCKTCHEEHRLSTKRV
jgi:hypothetical protein